MVIINNEFILYKQNINMNKEELEIIKTLVETNDYDYNLLKAAEELNELSLVLIQTVLKKKKVDPQEVIDEIGDVKIRIKIIEEFFDKDKVKERIHYKISKFKEYLEKGKYKNGI
jgi:hypothetical protein